MFQKKKKSLVTMTVFLLVIMILPLNIISIFIMNSVLSNTRSSLISSITMNLEAFMSDLDDKMEAADYCLYSISNSDHYLEYAKMAKKDKEDWSYVFHRYNVHREMQDALTLVKSADCAYFYVPENEDFLFVEMDISDAYISETTAALIQNTTFDGSGWHLASSGDNTFLIRNISKDGIQIGAIIDCQKNLPAFEYQNYELDFSASEPFIESDYISCSAASKESDCILTFYWPQSELSGNIEHWKYFSFFIVFVCILAIPVLYFCFKNYVSVPLDVLNHAHHQLQIGNESYRISAKANSQEFEKAYLGFNNMSQNLQELRLETINRELAYKQMQLNNLQLQIRPHFLLNMMNLLFTLIQNQETEHAQDMVLYLSNYFRYMFRNGKDLNLFSKELDLIQNYLKVSAYQHPGAFTVSYQIDPVIELLRIPPLLIHNFVENIIHHALMPDREVHIILFGEYEDHMVTLQISDDGRGMSEEDVDMINHCAFPEGDSGKHVGIRNSITRLQYYWNGQAKVTVESCPNMGTTFSVYIPCDLEEANDDTLNCE